MKTQSKEGAHPRQSLVLTLERSHFAREIEDRIRDRNIANSRKYPLGKTAHDGRDCEVRK